MGYRVDNWITSRKILLNLILPISSLLKLVQSLFFFITSHRQHRNKKIYVFAFLLTYTQLSCAAAEKNQKFIITKGKQYEVCRVFNDYLNSPYHNKSNCTIKEYPLDKRLRSPEYKQVDIFQYEDYLTAKDIYRSDEENARRIKNTKARIKSGEFTAWTTTVDVKNDGKKEAVVSIRSYLLLEGVVTQSCNGLSGINRLVNGKIDNSAWDRGLDSPILFDGRTFLLGQSGGSYFITEPTSVEVYRDGAKYSGDVAIVEVCNFGIKN